VVPALTRVRRTLLLALTLLAVVIPPAGSQVTIPPPPPELTGFPPPLPDELAPVTGVATPPMSEICGLAATIVGLATPILGTQGALPAQLVPYLFLALNPCSLTPTAAGSHQCSLDDQLAAETGLPLVAPAGMLVDVVAAIESLAGISGSETSPSALLSERLMCEFHALFAETPPLPDLPDLTPLPADAPPTDTSSPGTKLPLPRGDTPLVRAGGRLAEPATSVTPVQSSEQPTAPATPEPGEQAALPVVPVSDDRDAPVWAYALVIGLAALIGLSFLLEVSTRE
jgi:hypothetical protein